MASYLFTSESVSDGHPDKLADRVSDAILDLILEQDKDARVAVETLVKTVKDEASASAKKGWVILAGEVSSRADLSSISERAREVIVDVGYDSDEIGFDGNTCEVRELIGKQSPDIARGVDREELGAGDQGLMFGFACDETPQLMPAPIMLAHNLVRKQRQLRKSGALDWLGPDAKSQVTMRYEWQGSRPRPVAVDTVVLSTQHSERIEINALRDDVREHIIAPVLAENGWEMPEKLRINPTGKFVTGGPASDCGLTGRKIIVDTYGGAIPHGGGAFSGKDPSKVDRSAAYGVRHVAKNVVAAGLAKRCELQISYAIGVAEPVSIKVDTFSTGELPDAEIQKLIERHFDLTPRGLIERLSLDRPIYLPTSAYGHFGREAENGHFTWEKCDIADRLRAG